MNAYATDKVGNRIFESDFTSMYRCVEGCVASTPNRFVNVSSSGHSLLPTACGPSTPMPIAS